MWHMNFIYSLFLNENVIKIPSTFEVRTNRYLLKMKNYIQILFLISFALLQLISAGKMWNHCHFDFINLSEFNSNTKYL